MTNIFHKFTVDGWWRRAIHGPHFLFFFKELKSKVVSGQFKGKGKIKVISSSPVLAVSSLKYV